ncbi:Trm112 family protein [Dactylosporangium sp. NPDC051485]|uniref:Trm112 family protein n=1 Tax=Dactylosporangium sp. NPDC051485 TaxID=3154846 RepID=UPI00343132E6
MSVDPALLSILRCPDEHHAELTLDEQEQTLTCTECRRIFEIRDGIPVLLLDEARQPVPGKDATDEEGAE